MFLRYMYILECYAVCMRRRTTLEIDEDLLTSAKDALGCDTIRATVEEALRRATREVQDQRAERARRQVTYLDGLRARVDLAVLDSEQMWR